MEGIISIVMKWHSSNQNQNSENKALLSTTMLFPSEIKVTDFYPVIP